MESFCNHLKGYEPEKVESVMRALMKHLAATLSQQRGVQYEFGPEYEEYMAKITARQGAEIQKERD